MKIKICGMNNPENLFELERLKPDYFGFIFYLKSPRNFDRFLIPGFAHTKKVGVFVNETISDLAELQSQFKLEAVQLHGDEDQHYIKDLKMKLPDNIEVFKAISVYDKEDLKTISAFEDLVDLIILDTKTKQRGGSGRKFDWKVLEHYTASIPFLLSGGIGVEDAQKVCEVFHQHDKMLGVDINSKFEIEPGLKDKTKVERFINEIKSVR